MKKKEIAVFIPSLAGGGAERVAVALANEFANLGHTTHLLVATKAPAVYRHEVSKRVKLHLFNTTRTLNCIFALARFIKTNKPYAMLAIMDQAYIVAYGALLISGQKKNIRFFVREAVSMEYKKTEFTGIKGAIKRTRKELLTRHVYPAADGVISPSIVLKDSLHTKYGPKIKVTHIDNPVVTEGFEQRATEATLNLPWQGDHKIIVSAGRFTPQKDFIVLVKAFQILRETVHCKLILLGKGPELESIENFIVENNLSDHCYLPGFVINPLPYFVAADVFVLSSKYEGSPNVLIQALACGAAVVSTNCPTGPSEILVNEDYGILVPVGNEIEMASAIKLKLSTLDNNKQQKIAKTIRSKYDSKIVASRYLSLIDPNAYSDTPQTSIPDQ